MKTFDNEENLLMSLYVDNKCSKCMNNIGCYLNNDADKEVCLDTKMSLFNKMEPHHIENAMSNLMVLAKTQQEVINEVMLSRKELDRKIVKIMTKIGPVGEE